MTDKILGSSHTVFRWEMQMKDWLLFILLLELAVL